MANVRLAPKRTPDLQQLTVGLYYTGHLSSVWIDRLVAVVIGKA